VTRGKGARQSPAVEASSVTGDGSRWNPVNDFLINGLRHIDGRLLAYLDTENELAVNIVQRLRLCARAMLDGSMTPSQVADEWADWFLLTPAFIAAYGTWELADLGAEARFPRNGGVEHNAGLTEADRAYLSALEVALDAHLEMRTTH